jgi:hypothetical protein
MGSTSASGSDPSERGSISPPGGYWPEAAAARADPNAATGIAKLIDAETCADNRRAIARHHADVRNLADHSSAKRQRRHLLPIMAS